MAEGGPSGGVRTGAPGRDAASSGVDTVEKLIVAADPAMIACSSSRCACRGRSPQTRRPSGTRREWLLVAGLAREPGPLLPAPAELLSCVNKM